MIVEKLGHCHIRGDHEILDEMTRPRLLDEFDTHALVGTQHCLSFDRIETQRPAPPALRAQALRSSILQPKLILNSFGRGRRQHTAPIEPCTHARIRELRFVVDAGEVDIMRFYRAIRRDEKLDHDAWTVGVLRKRSELSGEMVRQHRIRHDAGVYRAAIRRGETIGSRVFADRSIDIRDTDSHAHIAVRKFLGDLYLIEVHRRVVVDRRPWQRAQVLHISDRQRGGIDSARDFGRDFSRNVRMKSVGNHRAVSGIANIE